MYTNRLILRFLRFVRLPGINNLLIPGPPCAYVFDHLDQEPWKWTAADRKVAEEISSYWVNFARSGNPNGSDLPTWPAFTNVDGKVLYLGDPITVGGVANINSLSVFDARAAQSSWGQGPLVHETPSSPMSTNWPPAEKQKVCSDD
jgi:hypothetical protein